MKNGFSVFCVALAALGLSWIGLVLGPVLQLGHEPLTTVLNSTDPYPIQPAGAATLGLQVYKANGCAACHTEQVQQDGVVCNVVLSAPGLHPDDVSNLLSQLDLNGLTDQEASIAAAKIAAVGGKTEIRVASTGGDMNRGWGLRRSVSADYLYDQPVQLGSVRIGPDLADIGTRQTDAKAILAHLYAPQSCTAGSLMPSFKFLFVTRKVQGSPSPDALALPQAFAPPDGFEIVPTQDAKNLVAYLMNLHVNVPLYEAPFTPSVAANK